MSEHQSAKRGVGTPLCQSAHDEGRSRSRSCPCNPSEEVTQGSFRAVGNSGTDPSRMVTDGGQVTGIVERLRKWHTEPATFGRIGEVFVRATVAGLVGIGFSVGVLAIFGESAITTIGLMTPLYFTLKWGFPDHYVDTETDRSEEVDHR